MRITLPLAVLTASLAALPVEADERKKSRVWLDNRGTLSLTDLEHTLRANFTPANRTKLDVLLAQRNTSLTGYNDQIAQVLSDDLKATDKQIAARVENNLSSEWPPERLEAIRRAQPQRYIHLIKRLNKDAERNAANLN